MVQAAPESPARPSQPVSIATMPRLVSDIHPQPIQSMTVLIPVMNEEGNLHDLYKALTPELEKTGLPYEILIVDDGSQDRSWEIIQELNQSDPRVVGLRHRRNFGKAQGLSHGFAAARGDVVITMDGDLQDDPKEIERFLELLYEGNDLVSGWKQRRQDPLGKTFPSKIFNWTVRKSTGVQLHDFNCGFKAYRREVTQSIRLYGELHRFTPVLANAEGFRVAELPVAHHARRWGSSKYGWSRLTKGFLDLLTVIFITRYRQRPMHLFGLPGILFGAIGGLMGLWLAIEKFINNEAIGGRPLLMAAVLMIVIGTQFFGLGLLGEYLSFGNNAPQPDKLLPLRETAGLGTRPALSQIESGKTP